MAQTWDEQGNEIKAQSWDEHGNPIGSGDKLTEQTQATAKASGASIAPEPMPSGYEPVTKGNDETQHPNNPIYQKLAQNDQLTKRAHTLQSMPSSYDAPLTNATGALGLAEIPANIRSIGNWAASKMREPATSAESFAGKAGVPKNILPRSMQRWTIPDWVAEGITPVGEKGTPTNPGPFENLPKKAPIMKDAEIVNRDVAAHVNAPRSASTTSYVRKPGWANVPENAPPQTPATGPVTPQEPPWAARGRAVKANPRPATEIAPMAPETPATATVGGRPTNTEEFLTNLVKKPIWTPEDATDIKNAFGGDGLMHPGEGQTQYRARLMGMIRSSRAAQGMKDIESYPAPKGRP